MTGYSCLKTSQQGMDEAVTMHFFREKEISMKSDNGWRAQRQMTVKRY